MSDNDSDSEDLFEDSLVTSTRACDGRTNTAIVDVQVLGRDYKISQEMRPMDLAPLFDDVWTGSQVWRCSVVLSKYIGSQYGTKEGQLRCNTARCVELGSGCGLVALVCTAIGFQLSVATDQEPMVQLIARNAQLNCTKSELRRFAAHTLMWGDRSEALKLLDKFVGAAAPSPGIATGAKVMAPATIENIATTASSSDAPLTDAATPTDAVTGATAASTAATADAALDNGDTAGQSAPKKVQAPSLAPKEVQAPSLAPPKADAPPLPPPVATPGALDVVLVSDCLNPIYGESSYRQLAETIGWLSTRGRTLVYIAYEERVANCAPEDDPLAIFFGHLRPRSRKTVLTEGKISVFRCEM